MTQISFTRCLLILTALVAPAAAPLATAADFQGRVVQVIDGDGLIVSAGDRQLNVRLKDIDAPELKQSYGIASRQSLIAICGGEIATVDRAEKVRNGATSGRVTCNGTDAGAEQVRRGMAWAIEGSESPDRTSLHAIQKEARDARRGLWAQLEPVPPWAWRPSAKR